MQKLVIDIGNTLTKAGIFEGKKLLGTRYFESVKPQDIEEVRSRYPEIGAAILCTVATAPKFLAKSLLELPVFIDWHTYRPDLKFPVQIGYDRPETLGRDRIAVASAVAALYPAQDVLCIVFGSCVTYNLVDAQARFLGGAISPGLNMRLRAMHRFTEALPMIDIRQRRRTDSITNTQTALYSGAYEGLKYEVEGFIERYRRQFPDLRIVLTGGNASYFENSLNYRIFAYQNLVLRGLNEILDLNGTQEAM